MNSNLEHACKNGKEVRLTLKGPSGSGKQLIMNAISLHLKSLGFECAEPQNTDDVLIIKKSVK